MSHQAVYNHLVEDDAHPSAFFNHQSGSDQYAIKSRKRIGRLAICQLVIAALTIVASILLFVIRYSYHYRNNSFHRFTFPDGIFAGLIGAVCACFGLRVAASTKGKCVFITFFTLTIVTAVFLGLSIMISVGLSLAMSSGPVSTRMSMLVTIVRILFDVLHFVIAVVSSALVCSIWNRMGGCCGSQFEAPVIYVQTQQPHPSADNAHVKWSRAETVEQ